MGKKKGNQLSYAFHVVLNVGAKRKRFKLADTTPDLFGVCKSTAYRILKELVRQEILFRQGKRYRLLEVHKIKLTGIEDEMKRALIKQLLEYLDRGFSIQLKLYVAHEARKQLSKILDIPEYLTRDLAAGILNPPQPEQATHATS
jgi:hypothetical protein